MYLSTNPAVKASILITKDSLTSEESKAKQRFVNTLYVELVLSTLAVYGKTLIYKDLRVI